MTAAERLAAIYSDLEATGLPCLVLGGHAVRYYGIDRNTVDYDFHVALSPEEWPRLPELLERSGSLTVLEEGRAQRGTWRSSKRCAGSTSARRCGSTAPIRNRRFDHNPACSSPRAARNAR